MGHFARTVFARSSRRLRSRGLRDDAIQQVAVLVQQKTVLDVFSEDAAVYLLVPQLHGHKLQVRDDLHQSSFVQLVLYGHAFDVRELQVLLQTGGQRGLGHAASRAGLASGPFVFLLRAETPATSKLGGTIRREKVVFIKVQLRAVQPARASLVTSFEEDFHGDGVSASIAS